jgi:hypothetical protein
MGRIRALTRSNPVEERVPDTLSPPTLSPPGDRWDVKLVISPLGADPGGFPEAFGELELARFYLFSQ